jgi:hypothetical protein
MCEDANTLTLFVWLSIAGWFLVALLYLTNRRRVRLLEKQASDWKVQAIANSLLLYKEKRRSQALESELCGAPVVFAPPNQ